MMAVCPNTLIRPPPHQQPLKPPMPLMASPLMGLDTRAMIGVHRCPDPRAHMGMIGPDPRAHLGMIRGLDPRAQMGMPRGPDPRSEMGMIRSPDPRAQMRMQRFPDQRAPMPLMRPGTTEEPRAPLAAVRFCLDRTS